MNHYEAVACCACFSRCEGKGSRAMSQAVKDAFERNPDNYQQMKLVASAYANKKECSSQECVYHILAVQWLSKTFLGVIFAESNLLEKRHRI